MKIITKQSLIDTAIERWKKSFITSKVDYKFANGKTYLQMCDELDACEPLTEQKIINIFGHNHLCQNTCNECDKDVDVVVEVGQPLDYDSATARMCQECLNKAMDLLLRTKKSCEIVLLETDEYNHHFIGKVIKPMSDRKIGQLDYFHNKYTFDPNYWQACYIYIISNDAIVDGDWVLCNKTGKWQIFQVKYVEDEIKDGTIEYMRKIVVTNNHFLTYDYYRNDECDVTLSRVIPQLSYDFLKKYCEKPTDTAIIEFKKSNIGDRDSIVSINF